MATWPSSWWRASRDRLRREQAIRERAHEHATGRSTRATDANISTADEVVDRHTARRGVERLVVEGQLRLLVEVVHDHEVACGFAASSSAFIRARRATRRGAEVRHPRRAEVEHVAGEPSSS
jgi:hypothetical protein